MNDEPIVKRPLIQRPVSTVARWSALVALLCAFATVLALPFPKASRDRGNDEIERISVANKRLLAVRVELHLEGVRYRALSTLAQWQARAGDARNLVVVDNGIAASDRALVEARARAEWLRMAGTDSVTSARIFVTVDTGGVALTSLSRPLRGSETQYFALPSTATGQCVALIRLRGVNENTVGAVTPGPCAFYARYGTPGVGVHAWIERTGAQMAVRGDADAPSAARLVPLTSLPLPAAGCLVRGGSWCLDALGLGPDKTRSGTSYQESESVPGLVGSGRTSWWYRLGGRSPYFLSDMARDIGPAAFARFWRSSRSPEAAFRDATGGEFVAWTQRWLSRQVEPVAHEASVTLPNVAWLAVLIPVLIWVAIRRRERVLL